MEDRKNKINSLKLKFKKNLQENLKKESFKKDDEIEQKQDLLDLYYFNDNKKLGEGAHGVVRKCYSKLSNKPYAVKIIKVKDQEIKHQMKSQFLLEKRLKHQNLLKAEKLFINHDQDIIQYVMQFCDLQDLTHIQSQQKNGYFTEHQARKILKQVLEGVNFIHQKGICHRDLKPDNILISENLDQLKIIDFGVAKSYKNRKQKVEFPMFTNTGTVLYKAPELLRPQPYNQKVDLWAIGVITYQLLFNMLPYDSEHVNDLYDVIIQTQLTDEHFSEIQDEDQDELSFIGKNFIRKLLTIDKEKRISAQEALQHPWIYLDDFELKDIICNNKNKLTLSIHQSIKEQNDRLWQIKNSMDKTKNAFSPKGGTILKNHCYKPDQSETINFSKYQKIEDSEIEEWKKQDKNNIVETRSRDNSSYLIMQVKDETKTKQQSIFYKGNKSKQSFSSDCDSQKNDLSF